MKTEKRTRSIFLLILLVIGVSAATSWGTSLFYKNQKAIQQVSTESSMQDFKARFAGASKSIDTDFTVAAEMTVNAVVHITTKAPRRQSSGGDFFNDPFFEWFFGPGQRGQQRREQPQEEQLMPRGSGSGVIISEDGYIVTNNHVIDGATEIEVTLNDKRTFKAKLIGTDPATDIALIKIEEKKLPAISFGNSDDMKVGEWVLAVGNPFNLTSTVTAGIVSAKARNLGIIGTDRFGRRTEKLSIESFIQTDAAINPGNSGGALVNTSGELIGINTAIASQTGSYAGYGFAVPSSIVQKVVTDLRQHGIVQRAMLGVSIRDIDDELSKEKKLKTFNGAYVAEVIKDGTADKAGVKADDVINNINGITVKSSSELQEQVSRYRPGDKITIGVLRGDKQLTLKANLMNLDGNTELVKNSEFTTELGVKLSPVNATIKEALGIEHGLEVSSVGPGKFNDEGIKPGYIILKINNKTMSSISDFEKVYEAATKSKGSLNIAGVYPTSGKISYHKIDLSK